MPVYDYHCETCGLDFEVEQSFAEDTLARCPTKKSGRSPEGCAMSGRGRVVKVFSVPGITFKGSGFYKTDSRAGSSSKPAKSSSAESGGSDSGGSSSEKSSAPDKSDKSTASASTTSASD